MLVRVDHTLGVVLDELQRLRGAVLDMKVELENIARETAVARASADERGKRSIG
jgi:hypothetical protein